MKALQDRVQTARVEYDRATERYRALMTKVRSGTPEPDDVLQQAGGHRQVRSVGIWRLFRRLANFELRGILPAHFKGE